MGESEWKLEPEGDTEVPEIIVSDAVDSTCVNLDGKAASRQKKDLLEEKEKQLAN